MSVKLSQLKQQDIRAIVAVEGLGNITIFNPQGAIKFKLIDFIKTKMGSKGIEINQNEVITLFMSNLTDMEIDVEDISAIVDNGSIELTKVMFYLTTIVQELTYEVLVQQNLELQMLEKSLLADTTVQLTNNIEDIVKEKKKEKRKKK